MIVGIVHVLLSNEIDDVDPLAVVDDDRIELEEREVEPELHSPIRPPILKHVLSLCTRTPFCIRASPASRAGGTLSECQRSYR